MKKVLFTLLLVTFLAGVVQAHHYSNMYGGDDYLYKEKISKTLYPDDDKLVIKKTSYAYYDNDKRYSTYDYRHGYTYRTNSDYWSDHYGYDKRTIVLNDKYGKAIRYDRDYDYYDSRYFYERYWDYDHHDDYYYDHDYYGDHDDYYRYKDRYKETYLSYNKYRDRYESHDCYTKAPRGKLFYFRC